MTESPLSLLAQDLRLGGDSLTALKECRRHINNGTISLEDRTHLLDIVRHCAQMTRPLVDLTLELLKKPATAELGVAVASEMLTLCPGRDAAQRLAQASWTCASVLDKVRVGEPEVALSMRGLSLRCLAHLADKFPSLPDKCRRVVAWHKHQCPNGQEQLAIFVKGLWKAFLECGLRHVEARALAPVKVAQVLAALLQEWTMFCELQDRERGECYSQLNSLSQSSALSLALKAIQCSSAGGPEDLLPLPQLSQELATSLAAHEVVKILRLRPTCSLTQGLAFAQALLPQLMPDSKYTHYLHLNLLSACSHLASVQLPSVTELELEKFLKLCLKAGESLESSEVQDRLVGLGLANLARELTHLGYEAGRAGFSAGLGFLQLTERCLERPDDSEARYTSLDNLARCYKNLGKPNRSLAITAKLAVGRLPAAATLWAKIKRDLAATDKHKVRLLCDEARSDNPTEFLLEELRAYKSERYNCSVEMAAVVNRLLTVAPAQSLARAAALVEGAALAWHSPALLTSPLRGVESCEEAMEITERLGGLEARFQHGSAHFWRYQHQMLVLSRNARVELSREEDTEGEEDVDVPPQVSLATEAQVLLGLERALELWGAAANEASPGLISGSGCLDLIHAAAHILTTACRGATELKAWRLAQQVAHKVKDSKIEALAAVGRLNVALRLGLLPWACQLEAALPASEPDSSPHLRGLLARSHLHMLSGKEEEGWKQLQTVMSHPILAGRRGSGRCGALIRAEGHLLEAKYLSRSQCHPVEQMQEALKLVIGMLRNIASLPTFRTDYTLLWYKHAYFGLLMESTFSLVVAYHQIGSPRDAVAFIKEHFFYGHQAILIHWSSELLLQLVEIDQHMGRDFEARLQRLHHMMVAPCREGAFEPLPELGVVEEEDDDVFLVGSQIKASLHRTVQRSLMAKSGEANSPRPPSRMLPLPDFFSHPKDCQCSPCNSPRTQSLFFRMLLASAQGGPLPNLKSLVELSRKLEAKRRVLLAPHCPPELQGSFGLSPPVLIAIARACVRKKDYAEALSHLEQAHSLCQGKPQLAEVLVEMATCRLQQWLAKSSQHSIAGLLGSCWFSAAESTAPPPPPDACRPSKHCSPVNLVGPRRRTKLTYAPVKKVAPSSPLKQYMDSLKGGSPPTAPRKGRRRLGVLASPLGVRPLSPRNSPALPPNEVFRRVQSPLQVLNSTPAPASQRRTRAKKSASKPPETPAPHQSTPTAKLPDTLRTKVLEELHEALNLVEPFPPAVLYARARMLQAILGTSKPGAKDEPAWSSFNALSDSMAVTLRHQAQACYAKKVRKAREAGSDLDSLLQLRKELTPGAQLELDRIPEDWTVVHIAAVPSDLQPTTKETSPDLLLTRYTPGQTPLLIHVSPSPQLRNMLSLFEDLLHMANSTTINKEPAVWWRVRHDFDRQMRELLTSMEDLWLGWLKVGLLPASAVDSVLLEPLARLVAAGLPLLNPSQRDQALAHFPQLASLSPTTPSSPKSGPLLLVLDKNIQALPWENLPMLRRRAVSRIPVLSLATANLGVGGLLREGVDPTRAFYVLNPAGDLPSTQARFQDEFEAQQGWTGVVGVAPEPAAVSTALAQQDLVVYCGHGSGQTYLAGTPPERLLCRAALLLIGCSSGRLRSYGGALEPHGVVLQYLLAGAPAVLSTLWDVTDKDIDRFTAALLQHWLPGPASLLDALIPARTACKLPYLIGAAPVVYGLPVSSQPVPF